jgi:hypothetical protein
LGAGGWWSGGVGGGAIFSSLGETCVCVCVCVCFVFCSVDRISCFLAWDLLLLDLSL